MIPPLHISLASALLATLAFAEPAAKNSSSAKPSPTPGWHGATPGDAHFRKSIGNAQRKLLFAGKFDELEQASQRFTRKVEPLRDGSSRLAAFFTAFQPRRWSNSPDWNGYLAHLRDWLAKHPDSQAANLAAASFYIEYAWLARGGGYANTVTEKGWQLFKERLDQAQACFSKVGSPAYQCSVYWQDYISLSMGLGLPKSEVLATVEKALPKSSCQGDMLGSTCLYLLPRWYGEEGEWQKWLDEQTQRSGGDTAYATAVVIALNYVGGSDGKRFGNGLASWKRTRDGLLALESKYPQSTRIKSELLHLAFITHDKETARDMIARMGGTFESEVLSREECEKIDRWLAK